MTKTANPGPGKLPATGNYTVGYKKPPKEHQFKPGHLRDGSKKAKEKAPDIAALFDKPLQVKCGGKTVAMHPFEAELTSLGKRALKGEPRATKLFLKHCEAAGLLDPPPAEQTHGVFVIPRGVNSRIIKVLLETYGLPPWDPEIYAALEAEYERDQAHIEELHTQFLKEHENEPQN
jgi:hypothetical protein